jgi:hypothetical protein
MGKIPDIEFMSVEQYLAKKENSRKIKVDDSALKPPKRAEKIAS